LCTALQVRAERVDWDTLFTGEVVLETVHKPDGIAGLRASFVVAAPRERIWTALTDYPNFPKMFPEIRTIHVLTQDAQGAQVAYEIKALFSKYHYVLQRHYADPGRRLTWQRVSGDLKRIEGSWEIRDTPRPAAQLIVYESYIDIGGIVPMALVRSEAMRHVQEMGERLRLWIEGRSVSN
jgi:ribosome-associated toxin RatA of RatAB toxin-antitoxin module